MSKSYKIVRWDGIITPSNPSAVPGLYIQPDQALIDLQNERGQISIKIVNTNSAYDQKLAFAIVQPSAITGGFRPNFQDQTDLWVVLPEIVWEGYPRDLGHVEVLDFAIIGDGVREDFTTESGFQKPQTIDNCLIYNFMYSFVALTILYFIMSRMMS